MRNSPILDALFPKIRAKILAALLLQPEKRWYLTELAHYLGTQPSSLQREVAVLSKAGLLEQTKDGIYSIICGSKRVVRGMGFIKKGTAIFALSFRHGKIYQPMCS
jgi:DNA-binding transcriptional ArsR family regulator